MQKKIIIESTAGDQIAVVKPAETANRAECRHKRVNYSDPLCCDDCGAVLTNDLKAANKADSSPSEAQKPKKGAITRLEAVSAKERVFVVNGVKFFAAVGGSGHRILSACDESKTKLQSAGRVLTLKGYEVKVKRNRKEKALWVLEAKEKVPSGPWAD